MGKYLHYCGTDEDLYRQKLRWSFTEKEGLYTDGHEVYFLVNIGFNRETGRYIWENVFSVEWRFETVEQFPDAKSGFTAYYDDDYVEEIYPDQFLWTTMNFAKENCQKPFVAFNPNIGVAYNRNAVREYESVDLGLPSGLLWASCNVGACCPEDSGGYYSWAETEEKSSYHWRNNYKWGDQYTMNKYTGRDDLYTIELDDDVAHVLMGGYWRMPTRDDVNELNENTTITSQTLHGTPCCVLTSTQNGNTLIIPMSGRNAPPWDTASYSSFSDVGENASVWTSGLYAGNNRYAYFMYLEPDGVKSSMRDRCTGLPVRGVMLPPQPR